MHQFRKKTAFDAYCIMNLMTMHVIKAFETKRNVSLKKKTTEGKNYFVYRVMDSLDTQRLAESSLEINRKKNVY